MSEYLYSFIDKREIYIYPGTTILKNKLGITDKHQLSRAEHVLVSIRLDELINNPIRVSDSMALEKIHHYLFQDVYEWAGEYRVVEIAKEGTQFQLCRALTQGKKYIDQLISEFLAGPNDVSFTSNKLAEILDNVNYMHPFREGNGRTQRELIRCLALEKNYHITIEDPDNPNSYEKYMEGTINGDVQLLADLFRELLS